MWYKLRVLVQLEHSTAVPVRALRVQALARCAACSRGCCYPAADAVLPLQGHAAHGCGHVMANTCLGSCIGLDATAGMHAAGVEVERALSSGALKVCAWVDRPVCIAVHCCCDIAAASLYIVGWAFLGA